MAHTLQLFALDTIAADRHNATYCAPCATNSACLAPTVGTQRHKSAAPEQSAATTAAQSPIDRLAALSFVVSLASIYSGLLEETITPRRTLALIHAQVAVIAAMLPINLPIMMHVVLVAWAIAACFSAK